MHQSRRFVTVFALLAVMMVFAGMVFAQQQALTIKDILAKAEAPLTADQAKKLSSVKIGGDFSVFQEINTMFTEKQTASLKEAFGSSPSFDGGPDQPRMLFFAIIFENEECPFSAEQIAKIKGLNGDDPMAMFGEMQNIFNEKQNGVMQAMMPQ